MVPKSAASDENDHEEHDGCLCDIEIADHEITPDENLPQAVGGVEAAGVLDDDDAEDSEIDGCDLDFESAEPTADEYLPTAAGGVA